MRMLLLKTWRDMLARKGQFVALILLVALGILSFVAFLTGYLDLKASVEKANRLGSPTSRSGSGRAARRAGGSRTCRGGSGRVRSIGHGLEWPTTGKPRRGSSVPVDRAPTSTTSSRAGDFPAEDARAAVMLHTKFASETGTGRGRHAHARVGGERKTCA